MTQSPCAHGHTEPVDVRDHTTGATTTVARICTDCLDQLHAGWGCPNCEWAEVDVRRLCELGPTIHHVLHRACREHA